MKLCAVKNIQNFFRMLLQMRWVQSIQCKFAYQKVPEELKNIKTEEYEEPYMLAKYDPEYLPSDSKQPKQQSPINRELFKFQLEVEGEDLLSKQAHMRLEKLVN